MSRARAKCGIAFDLDGVLWRSPVVFPFSKPTLMKVIEKQIPFVFVTNAGGKPESKKMMDINKRLDMEIDHSHLILSHSPLKKHLSHLSDDIILVSGNRDIHRVGLEYGFKNVISTGEILTTHPNVWPFDSPHKQLSLDHDRINNDNILNYDPTRISAIAVLNDGFCWGSECQIMMDALLYGKKNNDNDIHPPFYYTNDDQLWTTTYKYPRFAQGIYAGIVMDTFKRLTGNNLNAIQFGKPSKYTFDFAEDQMLKEANKLGFNDGIEEYYMIGDNPPGDIVGANNKGWKSILVKTGLYQEGKMDPQNPTVIHENAQDAVDWIIKQHSL